MKVNRYTVWFIIFAGLSFASLNACKKYLTKTPTDFLNPENYYDTQEQLEYSRRGVYSILGNDSFYGTYYQWALGWSADEAFVRLASPAVGPWNYLYSTSDVYNVNFWRAVYLGITRANELLANLDKNPEIAIEYRDMVRGEMLFLRAYYYFILVQYYGGVPLRLEPAMSPNDVDFPRSSIAEVYAKILEDMTTAETLVPPIAAIGHGGAVSKSAVRGILARVNLTMAGNPLKDISRLEEAKKWAKAVIDDAEAGHELNPSYADIFVRLAADQYDVKESIWEVEFWGNLSDQFREAGMQGSRNGPISNATSATGHGDGYINSTAKLYNSYEDGDLRKWFNIAHFTYVNSQINGEKNLLAIPATEAAKYNLKPAKFRREYETLFPKANRTPQNVSLLRYTDVLMMYVEAENELNGPTEEIIDIMNQIRRRSWSSGIKEMTVTDGGSGYTSAPDVVISGDGGAAAKAQINAAGSVTAIVLNRDSASVTYFKEGSYTTPPQVTLSGGGGDGAKAEVLIYSLDDANLQPEHTISKEAFRELIKEERMREFAFEGNRKADLLRWGDFLQVYQNMANQLTTDFPGSAFIAMYANASERDLFMPIPSIEVITNRAMIQNPGW